MHASFEFRWFTWQPKRKDFTTEEWRHLCEWQRDPDPHISRRRDLQYRVNGGAWRTVTEEGE